MRRGVRWLLQARRFTARQPRTMSTQSGVLPKNPPTPVYIKFIGGGLFCGLGYGFANFLFEFPAPIQEGLAVAQKNNELRERLGGEVTSPFYRRIFWGGSIKKDGRISFHLPIEGPLGQAQLHGKGLQNTYGDGSIWFYSLYAELDNEVNISLISEDDGTDSTLSEEDEKRAIIQSRQESYSSNACVGKVESEKVSSI